MTPLLGVLLLLVLWAAVEAFGLPSWPGRPRWTGRHYQRMTSWVDRERLRELTWYSRRITHKERRAAERGAKR